MLNGSKSFSKEINHPMNVLQQLKFIENSSCVVQDRYLIIFEYVGYWFVWTVNRILIILAQLKTIKH